MRNPIEIMESRLDVLTTFEPDAYVRFELEPNLYGWDTARCFRAIKADGWSDYYAIGPDGTWWCGGTNMPALLNWDVETLAQRAGV